MTATLCAADRVNDDLDVFDYSRLLDLSARIARDLPPEAWRAIVEAARPAASVDQRVAALLTLAGPLTDLVTSADEDVLLRAFLPRLSVADRRRAIAEVRDELEQVTRFENEAADGDWDGDYDPDERAMAFRSSARHTAETACAR